MIGYFTPPDFKSDGCTWWHMLNDLLGRDRYKMVCRRHDFECRYSIFKWNDCRDHFILGVRRLTPWYLMWRIPLFWIALTVARKRCIWTYDKPMPPDWKPYADRGYVPRY